jgi:UDP-glucuronate 4-epimerase
MLEGEKLLITGPTGMVGRPLTLALAKNNDVWAAARFSDAKARAELEAAGVRCSTIDLVAGDLGTLPADFTYLLNFSVTKTLRWGDDLDGNAGGIAALMNHCRDARAVLHCSSTGVYQPNGHHRFREDDPLGDNHRVMEFLATYSICKIAAEGAARFCARQLDLPTTIARLNVPYGDDGGWPALTFEFMRGGSPVPVNADPPSLYNPIHTDDMLRTIPGLLSAASVPATVVNWAGDETVSVEEWCTYMGELTGIEPRFEASPLALPSVAIDTTYLNSLVGPSTIGWKDGFRRMIASLHPELLRAS